MLRLLGDFVPHTPTGAPPLDPAGELPSPRPLPPPPSRISGPPLPPPQLWQSGAATVHSEIDEKTGQQCQSVGPNLSSRELTVHITDDEIAR